MEQYCTQQQNIEIEKALVRLDQAEAEYNKLKVKSSEQKNSKDFIPTAE